MIIMENKSILHPKPSEVLNYFKHGITSISIGGLEHGVILFQELSIGNLIDLESDPDHLPRFVWSRGLIRSKISEPRIIISSDYIQTVRDRPLGGSLPQKILKKCFYELPDVLPEGIEFFSGRVYSQNRVIIAPYSSSNK